VAPTDLLEAVCRHLSLSPNEITGQKRNRALTYARHLAMYLLREDGGLTYSAIAQLLGKKDHSTVVHACTQLLREINVSPSLRADIDAVRASLHIPIHAA
jgi:chromosomal replication initiator protein